MKAWIRAFASVFLPLVGVVLSVFGLATSGFDVSSTVALIALVPFALFMAAFFAHSWGEVLFSSVMTGVAFRSLQLWLAGLDAPGFHELGRLPLEWELVIVLAHAVPGLFGGWLARTIRRARGFPEAPSTLAPLGRQLACLAGTSLLFVVIGWFTLAPEVRSVFSTRCSEDPLIAARAEEAQTALWQAFGSARVTRLELRFLLSSRFCGAPQRTLCASFPRPAQVTGNWERFADLSPRVQRACER